MSILKRREMMIRDQEIFRIESLKKPSDIVVEKARKRPSEPLIKKAVINNGAKGLEILNRDGCLNQKEENLVHLNLILIQILKMNNRINLCVDRIR